VQAWPLYGSGPLTQNSACFQFCIRIAVSASVPNVGLLSCERREATLTRRKEQQQERLTG
jgi:hypothetical protein